MAPDEVMGVGEVAAPRDGAAKGAVALEGEAVEARPGMTLEPDGGLVFPDREQEWRAGFH